MDIDRFTELARKVLEANDAGRRHTGVGNLMRRIEAEVPGVVACCDDLICGNGTLRFARYLSDIYVLHPNGTARSCLSLLNDWERIERFEAESERQKRARKRKLEQFAGIVGIALPARITIGPDGSRRIVCQQDPDAIYYRHGIYRIFDEVRDSFEYRVIRRIHTSAWSRSADDTKILFKVLCLYVALRNEKAVLEEELALYGVDAAESADDSRSNNKLHIEPAHFSVDGSYEAMRRLLAALQQQGFVSASTTAGTFCYRMTGRGEPTAGQVRWIKRGKRRKEEISKRGLVYFIEALTGERVSKARACTDRIEDIFGVTLSSSTINSTADCEYRAELDRILEAR